MEEPCDSVSPCAPSDKWTVHPSPACNVRLRNVFSSKLAGVKCICTVLGPAFHLTYLCVAVVFLFFMRVHVHAVHVFVWAHVQIHVGGAHAHLCTDMQRLSGCPQESPSVVPLHYLLRQDLSIKPGASGFGYFPYQPFRDENCRRAGTATQSFCGFCSQEPPLQPENKLSKTLPGHELVWEKMAWHPKVWQSLYKKKHWP